MFDRCLWRPKRSFLLILFGIFSGRSQQRDINLHKKSSFFQFAHIIRISFVFLCSCFLFLSPTYTQETKEVFSTETVPNPKDGGRGYVSDPAAFINAVDIVQINQIIAAIEDSTTAQIAIVVLPSIGTENPKAFATELFNFWGIGQSNKDNGLLILSVMDQRRTEFETGYGMEAVLTDAQCYRIGMQRLVPHFKEGAYGAGLLAALEGIQEVLYNPDAQGDLFDPGHRTSYDGIIPGLPLGIGNLSIRCIDCWGHYCIIVLPCFKQQR